MAIKQVTIGSDCTACGLCGNICPEVFELKETSVVIGGADYILYETKIREAAKCCPVGVIQFAEHSQ
jgi:ferredoxin